jgi:hypothetical protein
LVIRNANTGGLQERLPMATDMVGGSPDWGWGIGDRIVAAMGPKATNFMPDVGLSQASLAEWRNVNGVWGDPQILVQQTGDESNDRPAYSPDGAFIAFNKTLPSTSQNQGNANSNLYLMDAEPGAVPVELAEANGGDELGNSWPKWSPGADGGRLWLAFSSTRDYGHRLVNSAQGTDARTPQIWITGIDRHAMALGQDPSAPSFWLPYQDIGSGNHIPYWAPYTKTE